MANEWHKPEEIVTKLRQVDLLLGQGMARVDAIREVRIAEQTYYRWWKQYGGTGTDQVRELIRLQKENERLRKAVSDLTLYKLILTEAARGNYWAPRVGVPASTMFALDWRCPRCGSRKFTLLYDPPVGAGLARAWDGSPASCHTYFRRVAPCQGLSVQVGQPLVPGSERWGHLTRRVCELIPKQTADLSSLYSAEACRLPLSPPGRNTTF